MLRRGPAARRLHAARAAAPPCRTARSAMELDSRVDGVGVDPRQPPLVWEAWTEDGWAVCEVDRDGTGGLNRPGEVVLHIPGGHTLSRTGGQEAGWLRCRVTEPLPDQPFYTTSPTVRSAEAFTIGGTTGAVHAETVYDEALGESTGLPGQRLRLAHAPVVGDTPPVLLQTAEHDGWARLGGRPVVRRLRPARPAHHPRRRHRRDRLRPRGPGTRRHPAPVRGGGPQGLPSSAPCATAPAAAGPGNVARGAVQVLRTLRPVRLRGRQPGGRARRGRRRDGGRRRRPGRPSPCAPRSGR